jgi:hypothetical protein
MGSDPCSYGNRAIFGQSYVGRAGGGAGGDPGRAVVITANGGAAWTPDAGNTWFALPGVTGFWAVAFARPKVRLPRGHGQAHSKDQFLAAVSALGLRPSHINQASASIRPTKSFLLVIPVT